MAAFKIIQKRYCTFLCCPYNVYNFAKNQYTIGTYFFALILHLQFSPYGSHFPCAKDCGKARWLAHCKMHPDAVGHPCILGIQHLTYFGSGHTKSRILNSLVEGLLDRTKRNKQLHKQTFLQKEMH